MESILQGARDSLRIAVPERQRIRGVWPWLPRFGTSLILTYRAEHACLCLWVSNPVSVESCGYTNDRRCRTEPAVETLPTNVRF